MPEKTSPTPWTMHTNTTGKNLEENVFIRCADPDDNLLGEIVAHIEKAEDGELILDTINETKKQGMTAGMVRTFRSAYKELAEWNDGNEDTDTDEVLEEIEKLLAKYGYDTE